MCEFELTQSNADQTLDTAIRLFLQSISQHGDRAQITAIPQRFYSNAALAGIRMKNLHLREIGLNKRADAAVAINLFEIDQRRNEGLALIVQNGMAFGIGGVERDEGIAIIVFLHVADNDEIVILQIEFTVEKRDHQSVISDIFCIGNSSNRSSDTIAVIAGNAPELQLVIHLCLDGRCAQKESQRTDRAQKIVAFYFMRLSQHLHSERHRPPGRDQRKAASLFCGFLVKT